MSSDEQIWHPGQVRDEDLTPLGRKIEARKDERGLSQRDIAKHATTYRKLVTGGDLERWVIRRAFVTLGWDPDSVPDALAGGEPRPLNRPSADTESDIFYAFEDPLGVFEGFAGITDEERQTVLEILNRGRSRLRARLAKDNGGANSR